MGLATGRFVGRDTELFRLGECAARARDGAPTVVVISGPAGIGKSRLVTEALAAQRGAKDLVALGHGVELAGGDVPYGTAADALRTLIRDAGADAVRDAAGPYLSDLAPICPALVRAGDPAGTAGTDRNRLLPAYAATVESLAHDRLVWLVVEDLHWADASSRDLLAYLTRVVATGQLIVLVTIRSRDDAVDPAAVALAARLAATDHATELHVEALTATAAAALITDLTSDPGGEHTAARTEHVAALGEGNPLLIEQLVAADIDSVPGVPETVMAPTLTRLRRLQPATQHLLQVASLADGHLSHRLLRQVLTDTSTDAGGDATFEAAVAEALDERLFVYEPQTRSYTFSHALLRQAIESTLRPAELLRGHRRWAEAMSRPENHHHDPMLQIAAAHHWAEADTEAEAFDAAIVAAEHAERLRANAELSTLLRRVLELWDRVDHPETRAGYDRDALVARIIFACRDSGRWRDAADAIDAELRRPQAATVGPWYQLSLRVTRATISGFLGDPPDPAFFHVLLDDLEELLEADAAPHIIHLLWAAGWRLVYADPDLSLRLFERCLILAGQLQSPLHIETTVANLANQLMCRGRFEECSALLRRTAAAAEDPRAAERLLEMRAYPLYVAGDLPGALAVAEANLANRDRHLMPTDWKWTSLLLTRIRRDLGQWDRTEAIIDQARRIEHDDFDAPLALDMLAGEVACDRGDLEAAFRFAQTARTGFPGKVRDRAHPRPAELVEESDLMDSCVELCHLEARIDAARGEVNSARDRLRGVLELPCLEVFPEAWPAAMTAARLETGDSGTSRASSSAGGADAAVDTLVTIEQAVARLPRAGAYNIAQYLQTRAELARARGHNSTEDRHAAVRAWREVGHPHRLGWSLFDLAAAHAEDGDRDAATAALAEAVLIAADLGAFPLRDAAVDLARRRRLRLPSQVATGGAARPRGERLARLTDREIEVLGQVARGASNDEIAASLVISPKTASVHVSRILAKLDVTTRSKAAAVAYEEGLDLPTP